MNNKLKGLSTVQNHHIGSGEYELPVTPDSEYIVDDSCFVPLSEAVKQLGLNPNFVGTDNKTMYDFPDGKDLGTKIPINRTKDGKDIAELSTEIANKQDEIANAIQKEKDFQNYQKEVQERMQTAKSTSE